MRIRWAVSGAALVLAVPGCLSKANPLHGLDGGSSGSSETSGTSEVSTAAGSSSGSSTSSSGSTDPTEASGSAGGSSGEPDRGGLCDGTIAFEETFSATPTTNDDWDVANSPLLQVDSDGDVLRVGMTVALGEGGYWTMAGLREVTGVGAVGLEVVRPPDPAFDAQAVVGLSNGALLLMIAINHGVVALTLWDSSGGGGTMALGDVDYDPQAHRWVRLGYDLDAATAWADVSPDGSDWTEILSADISALTTMPVWAHYSVGAWDGPIDGPNIIAIDNAFLCVGG